MQESTSSLPCIDRTDYYRKQLLAQISHCIEMLKEEEKDIKHYKRRIEEPEESKERPLKEVTEKVKIAIKKMAEEKALLMEQGKIKRRKSLEEIQEEENRIKKNKTLLTGEMNSLFTEIIQALEKSKLFYNSSVCMSVSAMDRLDRLDGFGRMKQFDIHNRLDRQPVNMPERRSPFQICTDLITETINRLDSIQTFRYIEKPDLKIISAENYPNLRERPMFQQNSILACYSYTYIPGIALLLTALIGMAHIQEILSPYFISSKIGIILAVPSFLSVFVFVIHGVIFYCRPYYRGSQYGKIISLVVISLGSGLITLLGAYWVLSKNRKVWAHSKMAKFLMAFFYISTSLSKLISMVVSGRSIKKSKNPVSKMVMRTIRFLYGYSCIMHMVLFAHITILIGFSTKNNTSTLFTIRVIGRFSKYKEWIK